MGLSGSRLCVDSNSLTPLGPIPKQNQPVLFYSNNFTQFCKWLWGARLGSGGSVEVLASLTNPRVGCNYRHWGVGTGAGGNRGQTGLTANFRQTAPKIHVSPVSPRGCRNEANLG